jgi:hypothetical protein
MEPDEQDESEVAAKGAGAGEERVKVRIIRMHNYP